MSDCVIKIDNIKRDFIVGDETVHALRGVSFDIHKGEFVTIMGASGSGKSTLLNILGCLDTPTSGEYLLDGIPVRTMGKNQRAILRNRKIGFVFQNYNLLAKSTAIENVELPLMYNPEISGSERRRRAIEALEAVGLGDRLKHKSNQMYTCGRGHGKPRFAYLFRYSGAVPETSFGRKDDNFRDPQSRDFRIQQPQYQAPRRPYYRRQAQ